MEITVSKGDKITLLLEGAMVIARVEKVTRRKPDGASQPYTSPLHLIEDDTVRPTIEITPTQGIPKR